MKRPSKLRMISSLPTVAMLLLVASSLHKLQQSTARGWNQHQDPAPIGADEARVRDRYRDVKPRA